MIKRDIAWSEKRRQSSRTLAFYVESLGLQWTSIREAAHHVAADLGITTIKKRRSVVAVECHEKLLEIGIAPPADYVAPWLRSGLPFVRRKGARKRDQFVAFYDSIEWKRLRFATLKERGRVCACCGAGQSSVAIHVDHIKSIRRHWHLRLDQTNVQVLCEDCNRGKGSLDSTDFRAA